MLPLRSFICGLLLGLFLWPIRAFSQGPPDGSTIATYTLPFQLSDRTISGAGADFLLTNCQHAQFVLIGESHHDHDTPLFVRALYDQLQRHLRFTHLVVEQDALGIDMTLKRGIRGRPTQIAQQVKKYPSLLGFASDQDIDLLAHVAATGHQPLWGIEQAQSPVNYLRELRTLAHTPAESVATEKLLKRVRRAEQSRADFGQFLAFDTTAMTQLRQLTAVFKGKLNPRQRWLLNSLLRSAEIYSYYRRAAAEKKPWFRYYNAMLRETWLKEQFMNRYARLSSQQQSFKAVFKFGGQHMRRGLTELGVWSLGTFLHELATYNGRPAYSLYVQGVGGYLPNWQAMPAGLKPLLPATLPRTPVVIDLRAIRPLAEEFVSQAGPDDQAETRRFIFGYDALIILPNSRKAEWLLTGFATP